MICLRYLKGDEGTVIVNLLHIGKTQDVCWLEGKIMIDFQREREREESLSRRFLFWRHNSCILTSSSCVCI